MINNKTKTYLTISFSIILGLVAILFFYTFVYALKPIHIGARYSRSWSQGNSFYMTNYSISYKFQPNGTVEKISTANDDEVKEIGLYVIEEDKVKIFISGQYSLLIEEKGKLTLGDTNYKSQGNVMGLYAFLLAIVAALLVWGIIQLYRENTREKTLTEKDDKDEEKTNV